MNAGAARRKVDDVAKKKSKKNVKRARFLITYAALSQRTAWGVGTRANNVQPMTEYQARNALKKMPCPGATVVELVPVEL